MNKNLKYFILLVSGILTLASPTCEEEVSPGQRRQERIEALQLVAEDFRSESLTTKNLEAFEFKAVEKLMDYADYLSIVYNYDIDTSFRNLAQENIRQLFTQRSAPAQPVPDHIIPSHIIPDHYTSLQFIVDSIEIIQPLQRQATETYKGRMRYSQQILGITGTDTLNLDTSLHQMGIQLQMRLKDFGENSLLVWEVLLSDEE